MDLPPPPGAFDNLPPPLIPSPVDTSGYDDVYTVGEPSVKRWRTFINCLDWNPRKQHEEIMVKRAYHARSCWEASLLLSFTDSTWLSTSAYEMIRDAAHYELRKVEIELLSFQLTCGSLGIDMSGNKDSLYNCTAIFYTTMMHFANRCVSAQKAFISAKEQRQDRKDLAQFLHMRPYPHHGAKELATNLDRLIHAVHTFLIHFPVDANNGATRLVANKLKQCIQLVDPIIVVIKN